jgi:hypothetical protein
MRTAATRSARLTCETHATSPPVAPACRSYRASSHANGQTPSGFHQQHWLSWSTRRDVSPHQRSNSFRSVAARADRGSRLPHRGARHRTSHRLMRRWDARRIGWRSCTETAKRRTAEASATGVHRRRRRDWRRWRRSTTNWSTRPSRWDRRTLWRRSTEPAPSTLLPRRRVVPAEPTTTRLKRRPHRTLARTWRLHCWRRTTTKRERDTSVTRCRRSVVGIASRRRATRLRSASVP